MSDGLRLTKLFYAKQHNYLWKYMFKQTYHPNAYLSNIKNVKLGLRARTRILDVLEKLSVDAKSVAKDAGMPYGVVMHHMKLLEAEGIVNRKGSKPYVWTLTGLGQKRLETSC